MAATTQQMEYLKDFAEKIVDLDDTLSNLNDDLEAVTNCMDSRGEDCLLTKGKFILEKNLQDAIKQIKPGVTRMDKNVKNCIKQLQHEHILSVNYLKEREREYQAEEPAAKRKKTADVAKELDKQLDQCLQDINKSFYEQQQQQQQQPIATVLGQPQMQHQSQQFMNAENPMHYQGAYTTAQPQPQPQQQYMQVQAPVQDPGQDYWLPAPSQSPGVQKAKKEAAKAKGKTSNKKTKNLQCD